MARVSGRFHVFPSTMGEGSLIFRRIPVAAGRALLCEIKILLGLLACLKHDRSLDLGEEKPIRPLGRRNSSFWETRFFQSYEVALCRDLRPAHTDLGPCPFSFVFLRFPRGTRSTSDRTDR